VTIELKDWLNSINFNKNDLSENISDYTPFIINRCISGSIDTILFSNEMNINHELDVDMQYSFYLNSIRKKKRFAPWIRKDKLEDLEVVKRYYNYNNEKAFSALRILTKEQLSFIKQQLDTGGMK
jgi:hypothetical protein